MPDQSFTVDHLFPLNALWDAMGGYQPPAASFDPWGNWRNVYRIYQLIGLSFQQGLLTIGRVAKGGARAGRFVLQVTQEKVCPGNHRQHLDAELTCANDPLATPLAWRFRSEMRDREGRTLAETVLEKAGRFRDGQFELTAGERRRTLRLPGACAMSWGLFDAVQRWPHRPEPAAFTLLDEFDQPKPGHSLAWRDAKEYELGGEDVDPSRRGVREGRGRQVRKVINERKNTIPTRLHAFQHLGPGTLPMVYYTDDAGRLLFAVNGLVGLLLDPAASTAETAMATGDAAANSDAATTAGTER
ncbi:MAG: hypothetical protein M1457_07535 [bacterium]|nr:hypothetical protein [bacterium]